MLARFSGRLACAWQDLGGSGSALSDLTAQLRDVPRLGYAGHRDELLAVGANKLAPGEHRPRFGCGVQTVLDRAYLVELIERLPVVVARTRYLF